MAILANSAVRTGIQVVLGLVILVLGYFLFRTIREPAEVYERELALTNEARQRMDYVRDALVAYEREYNRYPSTLDSLVQIIRTDSLFQADR
ncbi:MAG: hypothetical protein R3362_10700, partial [Rhodothermales bacterium]|nr:hypothetical protein [Rhodothermales bacterium]